MCESNSQLVTLRRPRSSRRVRRADLSFDGLGGMPKRGAAERRHVGASLGHAARMMAPSKNLAENFLADL